MIKSNQRILFKFLIRAILIGIAAWALSSLLLGRNGVLKQSRLENENELLKQQIDSLKQQIEQTEDNIHKLQTDTFYLEEIARTRFGYTKEGESVYIIKEKENP